MIDSAASKGEQTKQRMVEAAAALIEAQGYHATGLNQLIAASGAPRGSLYYHFPGGKEALAAAAIRWRAGELETSLRAALEAAPDTQAAMRLVIEALTTRLEGSQWTKGCPVATVALEVSDQEPTLREACREAYAAWQARLAEALIAEGVQPERADTCAEFMIEALEGALLFARLQRRRDPLDRLRDALPALLAHR